MSQTDQVLDSPERAVRLVGRTAELEILAAELRRAAGRSFRFVLIDGGAGVGKSRLMNEALRRHVDRAQVLSARSYRLGATTSFGPWLEAMDRHALSTGDSGLTRELGSSGGGEPGRARLLETMTSTMARLADEGPLVVAIDDIHLADDSSWEALRFFSRRLWNRPIAVLATARGGGIRSRPLTGDVLDALGDDQALRRVNLRPLNATELAELARDRLRSLQPDAPSLPHAIPQSLVGWLMRRSLGHPLFALSLLDAVVEEGTDLAHPDLGQVPVSLRERVGVELGMLEPPQRQVLEVLAVTDQRTDPRDLADVLGWSLTAVGQALEELSLSRLVVERPAGAGYVYEIAHPIIQETIYELMGGARRMALHRTVGRVLLARDRFGAAAAHLARSSMEADEESLDTLCRAIREAESKGLYREALAIMGDLPDIIPRRDPRWLQVLDSITWQADWVIDHLAEGDAEAAITVMRRIEEVSEDRSDLVAQGIVQFHLASFLSIGAGRIDEAQEACRRSIELFDQAGEVDRSLLARNEMVWIHACAGRLERSNQMAAEVLADIDATTDSLVVNQAAGSRAYALSLMGRFEESEASYERAERAANTYRRIWGLAQRSMALALEGRLEEAAEAARAALDSDYTLAVDALGLERRAVTACLGGDLAECVRLIDESGSRRAFRGSRRRAWGLALAARALGEMGQTSRAERYLEQAADTYRDDDILDWSTWCPWAEGFLARVRGEHDHAMESLTQAAGRYREMGAAALEGMVRFDLFEAAADAGADDVVASAADRLDEIADRVGGKLLRLLGGMARALTETNPEAMIEAADRLEDLGYRPMAQSGVDRAGRALAAASDPQARRVLERAARMADESRAVWRRDRALAVLSETGAEGRRAAGAVLGPESLTTREREVAELAARGLTARQIADRLYIGTRTVESHLAHIYPKLGVANKRELVTNGTELGLLAMTETP